MADEWSRFGMVERIGLAIILLVLGAIALILLRTQVLMAGAYSAEFGQAFGQVLGLYMVGVFVTTMGGPIIRIGWKRLRPRLPMSQNV